MFINFKFVFIDRNECQQPLENYCDGMATCVNKPDGFACRCQDGYYGDGRVCRRKTFYMIFLQENQTDVLLLHATFSIEKYFVLYTLFSSVCPLFMTSVCLL